MKIIERIKTKLENDKHFEELIKGSITAFALRISGVIFSYLFTFAVTRKLGAKVWGIFALSMIVLQVASMVGKLGMDTALLRFVPEFIAKKKITVLKDIYRKILLLTLPFSFVVSVAVYLLSPGISEKVFKKPYLTNSFQLTAFAIVPFVLLGINREAVRGLKKIKEYMFFQQLGISLLSLCFFFGLIKFSCKNLIPVISYNLSIFVLSCVVLILWKKYLAKLQFSDLNNIESSVLKNSQEDIEFSRYSTILSVSMPMFFTSSLAMIMGWTDTIMLGMFRSTQEVGIYNVALKISAITSISLVAVNTIAAPKFAEFWGKGDMKGLAKVVRQSTKMIFWTSFPALLFFLIFPKQILGIFGNEFKTGASALMILTTGQFVNAFVGSVGQILNMTNNQRTLFYTALSSGILNILLNLLLIPRYKLLGAALSTATSGIFWNLLCVLYLKFKYNLVTFYIPKFLMRKQEV